MWQTAERRDPQSEVGSAAGFRAGKEKIVLGDAIRRGAVVAREAPPRQAGMAKPFSIRKKMDLKINSAMLTPDKMAAYGKAFPVAAISALNKTAQQAKTQASMLVRERYNLKKSDLDSNIKLKRASREKLEASLKVSGKRLPLLEFGARGNLPSRRGTVGVSVEVTRGRRHHIAGSFLAIMKSGHKGVFKRKAEKRLPIKELTGPSVPQMLYSAKVYGKLKEFVHAALPKNLASAINYLKK